MDKGFVSNMPWGSMRRQKTARSESNVSHQFLFLATSLCCVLVSGSCASLPPTNCPERSAFCPHNPSLKRKQGFFQTTYLRDLQFLSQCGPVVPGPICPTSVDSKKKSTPSTPFNAEKTCQAMALIQSGIQESPSGTWNTSAKTNLETTLKKETITVAVSSYGKVRYFYFVDQDAQWIVFLGSETLTNWLVDLRFHLVDAPKLGMKIHNGFLQTTQSVYEILKTSIDQNPNKKIRLAGHSLGGAVATILALMLTADKYTIETLITFGQPQITDASGALTFIEDFSSTIPLIRFTNHNDKVPFVMGWLNKDYRQFGPEVRLETNTSTTPPQAGFALLPEPDNTRTLAKNDKSGVTDHPPAAYAASLNRLFCKI